MPRCKRKHCEFTGAASEFEPSLSPYHDLKCPKCGTTAVDTGDMGEEYGYGDSNFLRADGRYEEAKTHREEVVPLMETIAVTLQHCPERDKLCKEIRGAVLAFHQEHLIKLEQAAINILLFEPGPEAHFLEIEDDEDQSIAIGERIPDPKFRGQVRIRITAKNIIDMENMS